MDGPDELEWEEWDRSKLSFYDHMIAGSIAGLAEHCTIFPMDTIKTNMQCDKCGSSSPFQVFTCAERIVRREGILRLWKGVSAMFAGCLPAHAAYFSIFEGMKTYLGADQPGHFPLEAAACGATAAFAHDLIMTPFDVLKQRLQLGYHNNLLECARSIIKTEGIGSLYRSFGITLGMNIPFGCVIVASNESMKKILNPSGEYNFTASMVAGSVAGGFASLVTTPLDVVKTRLQTQGISSCYDVQASKPEKAVSMAMANNTLPFKSTLRYYSVTQTIRLIAKEEGVAAFMRGVVPRIMTQTPSVAISWTAYEMAKSMISDVK